MIYIFKKIFILTFVLCLSFGSAYAQDLIPAKSSDHVEASSSNYPDLRLTPDKPEIVTLDRDVANIIVGNTDHLAVTPDTSRRLILIPRQPGATFLKVLAEDGTVLMARHILVAAPKNKENYVRIRRSCINGDDGCQEYSMYYCPDMCHKLGLVQDNTETFSAPETASPSSPETIPPVEPADGQ